MGSVCGTQIIPIIKVDRGDSKTDSTRKVKPVEKDVASSQDGQNKDEKVSWEPPLPTPMPKGIVLTPEPSRLTVEDNGARLSVLTHNSDGCSPSGSSLRSSTDCSVASSGRSMQIADRGKAPPRLLSLSSDLHQLLMGHLEDTTYIQARPKVIHLQVVIPPNGCTMERLNLWQHSFCSLRKVCSEKGYSLDIQDDLWTPHLPHSSHGPSLPGHATTHDWVNRNTNDVDVVLVILTEDHTYSLPGQLSREDFLFLQESINSSDGPGLVSIFESLYKNAMDGSDTSKYFLQRNDLESMDKPQVTRLVSKMVLSYQSSGMAIDRFISPYFLKLKSIVSNPSLLGKRSVVVSKQFSHIMNFDASSGFDFDPSTSSGDQEELTRIKLAMEKGCDPSKKFKLELPRADSKFHKQKKDSNQVYLKEMGITVCRLLKAVIESVVEEREMETRDTVTGVSQSLIDELVSQAARMRSLGQVEPMFYSGTLRTLQEYVLNFTEMPIVVYAPPGWGLSTMGVQLADYCKKEMPNALVMYRSLGITPDTVTLQSTLISLNQQLDTILGNNGQWEETMHNFPTKSLLRDIVTRSTAHLPIIVFLEGVALATSKLKELEVMTLSESLPPTTKLIVMTSDAAVTRGLRLKMKDAIYVKAIPWEKQSIADLFSKSISEKNLVLNDSQTTVIANAIKQCPLPIFAVTSAQIISILYEDGPISQGLQDFPVTIEGIFKKLFEILESYFPKNCFQSIMAYLTSSVGGITSWEMNDLLSTNDDVLQVIFAREKEPITLCRAPAILWKSFLVFLKPFLHIHISTTYYTRCLTSSTLQRHATERYLRNPGMVESFHKEMGEYFEGKWARTKKPYPLSDEQNNSEYSRDRYVAPQPTKHGSQLNVRKLICLPHHTIRSNSKSSCALEKFILNLPWVVHKLNGVSGLQVLLDLELAKGMEYSHAHPNDIATLQGIIFKALNTLTMCGKEINKILQHSVILSKYKSKKEMYKDSIYYNSTSYYKMIQSIDKIPFSHLNPLDKESTALPQLSPIPSPMINAMIPIHTNSNFVATMLKLEGEIRIVNTQSNTIVRNLKGLDRPTTLSMLSDTTAVVLCNRELYVINLDEGTIVNKLRIVLNLRKPLFGLQSKERVVALSRDRMVVNVIDLKTGGIVSSFKAGETRFLESLLLSKDGKMVVCGDETQKPYPLLAWSLEQGKLVHDIRMSQHEFITSMAGITDDGHYLACGCKEVSINDSNFIVVYDLLSGQLLKKFKMAGLVTALVISSKTLSVVASLDTSQLVVWDIVSGNRRVLLGGVHASVDNIQLSEDARRCLTSCTQEYSISAHTLSLWDIEKGCLLGTHTFHSQVTCANLSWDGRMVLAGVRGHSEPIRLVLVSPPDRRDNNEKNNGGDEEKKEKEGSSKGSSSDRRAMEGEGEKEKDEVFGNLARAGCVIHVSNV